MSALLESLIKLADQHQKADEYVTGSYSWTKVNSHYGACSVGCTVRDAVKLKKLPVGTDPGSHTSLSLATGIPEMLWRLSDNIFEGLARDHRSAWTPRFLRAANKAKHIDRVPARVMARCAERLAKDAIREDVKQTCLVVAALWRSRSEGNDPEENEWKAAREQADAAWKQAYAAREQAYAAREQAYAAREQADAARKQAYAAREQFWLWLSNVVCEELEK